MRCERSGSTPTMPRRWASSAHVCAWKKEFDAAVYYFDRALRLNPNLAFIWALSAADLLLYRRARRCAASGWSAIAISRRSIPILHLRERLHDRLHDQGRLRAGRSSSAAASSRRTPSSSTATSR